jgi:hypothetical protein
MTGKLWSELEAEGIKRCCAHFTNGTRCRHRAVEAYQFSWCAKHGPVIKAHENHFKRVQDEMRRKEEAPQDDEDDNDDE